MTGKRYSAGAIFLQVVPVFSNVQRAIEDEAKNIDRALGDSMERSGEKAGERAGRAAGRKMRDEVSKASVDMERDFKKSVEGMGNALDDIDMKKLSSEVRREVAAMKRELASLHDVDISVDANFQKAYLELQKLEHRIEKVSGSVPIVVRANIADAEAKLAKMKAMLENLDHTLADPTVDLDIKPAERKLGALERSFKKHATRASSHLEGSINPALKRIGRDIDELNGKRLGIDLSAGMALQDMEKLRVELARLATTDPDIQVRVDAAAAEAELAALLLAIKKLDGEDIDIDVDTRGAQRGLFGLRRGADDSANSFRAFNIVLFASATAGPALIPVLAAIAGGLLAIGPAGAVAVAALGAVAVGFSGIGGALQALGNQQDQAAMTAQTAARSEASAAKAVANARRSAARQIESALDRQRDAQKRYRDSVNDVREAEQALKDAREAARDNGEDIDRRVRSNSLAIDQALLDSFDATVNYNAVKGDGSSTNAEQEQARITMEEAKLRLEELRAEQKELAAEKKKWDEEGVNGTEEVQSAQENLNDAIDAQREAYEDLGDAARAVDEARADGARAVADAIDSQADAMQGLNAQQNAVDQAFAKMGESGRAFTLFLFGLRDEFRNFRNDIQDVLLPSVQEAIEGFLGSKSGSIARGALIALADSFGRFVKALSASFQGQAWQDFFTMLGTVGPQIQDAWGSAFISLMEALASILTTAAPFALEFARGLARMMESFANWAASEEGQDAILRFIGYVKEVGPEVLAFIGAFARGMAAVGEALAPLGELVLTGLTNFFDMLDDMDPSTLSAIATAMVAIVAASQSAYLVMNALTASFLLLTNPVGLIIFALVALGVAFAFLFKKNKAFRDFVTDAWEKISKVVKDSWNKYLKPALADLGDALKQLWDDILQPFFEWLGPILVWLATHLIPLVFRWWGIMARGIAWFIREVLIPGLQDFWSVAGPVLRFFGRIIKWLWEKVIDPVIGYFKKHWPEISAVISAQWDVISDIWDKMKLNGDKLKTAFEKVVDGIGAAWRGLKKVVGEPIKFVINTIIGKGIVGGINKVLKFVGKEEIDPPHVDWKFATGGVLPGYTPGRDVHDFRSPTGGRLQLSGGEAIMRPEWTAAMGKGYVDQMNSIAARGGVRGIRQAMGMAFAKGGIFWPLPGSTASTYKNHDGVDLNAPNDNGKPFYSATSGKVTTTGYSRGYGNAVFVNSPYGELVYGHSQDGSIRVRVGESVRPGTWLANVGSTGNSSGPHLHFGFPGGTYAQAMALLSGAAQIDPSRFGAGSVSKIPGWLKDLAKDPVGYVKNIVAEPVKKLGDTFGDSKLIGSLVAIPGKLVKSVGAKMWDMIPGPVKAGIKAGGDVIDKVGDGIGKVGEGIGNVVDDLGGYKAGGVLPYNGTMMYDDGGYLPPGLTTVMNLTGKPEPVFTDGQWSEMGKGGDGGTIHYEPHFEGSNLTPEDVAADLNFTFRRIRRGGKYAGVGAQ